MINFKDIDPMDEDLIAVEIAKRCVQGEHISAAEWAYLVSILPFDDLLPMTLKLGKSPLDVKLRRPMFRPMFTRERVANRIVYRCARQLGKSLSVAASILMNMIYRENFNALYCSPLSLYTQRLSHVYLDPLIRSCSAPWPIIDRTCVQNVCEKTMTTGSHYYGVSCFSNAGQALGIPNVASIYFDEVQDLDIDILPQVLQCSSANVEFGWETYTGTARGMENTIESLWSDSSQNMWHIRCKSCGHDNVCTAEEGRKMIQKAGVGCSKCSTNARPRLLNVDDGWWVPAYPEREEKFQGFHVPQIFISDRARVDTTKHFQAYQRNIYDRLHGISQWSPIKFDQEILGLSTEGGSRPLSPEQLRNASCLPYTEESPASVLEYTHMAGGVDWGGGSETTSFTVGCIVGRHASGEFHCTSAIRPMGVAMDEQPLPIAAFFKKHARERLTSMGGDGLFIGPSHNNILSKICMCPCASILYGTQKKFFNASGGKFNVFTVDKSTLIFIVYSMIISGQLKFPSGSWFEVYSKDLMSIAIEELDTPNGQIRRYSRIPSKADDFVHALAYGLFTVALMSGMDLPTMVGLAANSSMSRGMVDLIGAE